MFQAACERHGDARTALLDLACGDDGDLRREVEARLAHAASAGVLVSEPALAMAAAARMAGGSAETVLTGRRIGIYQVQGLLGSGGMGEVYRARDTQLGRDVAIKILPRVFSSDADRLARLEREARILASLNHPHICAIYGLEKGDDACALVLELVEGETLADRIGRGRVPLKDALAIADQLVDALDAAHERGIVHRDLKPANIRISRDGVVKVLDFGIAKTAVVDGTPRDVTQLPTMTVDQTDVGIIAGTAAYMSPEQARGLAVDQRTDIWAFGCVVFEMLSGRSPFARATIADTLGAVVEREPDWTQLAATTPASVRSVVRRCLEKDPKRRLRDIADARLILDDIGGDTSPGQTVAGRSSPGHLLPWSVAAIALAGLATVLWSGRVVAPPPHTAPGVVRTAIVLPANQRVAMEESDAPLVVSPDGTTVAYVAEQEGRTQLYIRDLSQLEPKPIPGASGARHPFFSPDGKWIGFFAGGELKKVAVAGGDPLRICSVAGISMGGSWGPDDTIVWASSGADLTKVAAAGGVPQTLAGSSPSAWPEILPDGKTVLFTTGVAQESSAIAAISLDGGAKRIVARTSSSKLEGPAVLGAGVGIAQIRFVPETGYLTYGQSQDPGAIRAIPFDPVSLSTKGAPVPLVGSVERGRNGGAVYFAVSRTGLMLYVSTGERHQLVWVDRHGVATPISTDRAPFRNPRLSPDGTQIAVAINDQTRRSDIWIYDVHRGVRRRLTTNAHNLAPVWTPDGRRITFASGGIFELAADASGTRDVVLSREVRTGTLPYPTSWSPNGDELLFQAEGRGLWSLPRGGTRAHRPLLEGNFSAYGGQFAPDGRWLLYVSGETGRDEIYVRRYPEFDNPEVVSTDGGTSPRWSRDGREIFYRQGDAMMAVAVQTTPKFRAENPRRLFAGQFSGVGSNSQFDVSPDGQRFVMIRSDEASALREITVVQNWQEELKTSVQLPR